MRSYRLNGIKKRPNVHLAYQIYHKQRAPSSINSAIIKAFIKAILRADRQTLLLLGACAYIILMKQFMRQYDF